MGRIMVAVISVCLVSTVDVFNSTVPFTENFELFSVGAEINGTNRWVTSDIDTAAGVSGRALGSSVAHSGSRAGWITNADLVNEFTDNQSAVFATFHTEPHFGPGPAIPSDASTPFCVNDSGIVVAYSNTARVTLTHPAIAPDTFVKFMVSADILRKHL